MMQRAHVFLHPRQTAELKALSGRTGIRKSLLIRQGVDLVINQKKSAPHDWRHATKAIYGIWQDRQDLDPLFSKVRTQLATRQEKLSNVTG